MEKKNIAKGIFINFFCFIIPSGIAFLVNRYFVKNMGISYLGLMQLFNQILAYISIVEMGLGAASTYSLYRPLAERNYERLNVITSTIASLYNKIAGAIFILGILAMPFIKFFIRDELENEKLYLYWVLYLISTVITYLFSMYNVLFTANQEYNFVKIVQASIKILCQILKITVIIKYKSFSIFILIMILENILQGMIFRKHYLNKYSYIEKTKLRDKIIVKDLKNLFFHKIGGLIVFNTDLILISKFLSLEVVGVYASYQIVISLIGNLTSIITGVLIPNVGRYVATNKNIFKLWKKINDVYFVIATIFSYCFYFLANDFIKLWLGDINLLPSLTVFLISVNLFILLYRVPIEMFKEVSGFFDDTYSPILESFINLFLSLFLIMKMGLNGVIIGTIVSNLLIILILKPILTFKRCFEKGVRDYLLIYGKNLGILCLGVYLANGIQNLFMSSEIGNIYQWILSGIKFSFLIGMIMMILILITNREWRRK
ncbi:polysaccharide biosynthesis protein [Fusobacterium sp. MFO224]|uniref:polysaccharide biosynthesis protein n=1 Tax=Fusobacterium sp. MFO224 TaxID=3378070 RepID=UPI0038525465